MEEFVAGIIGVLLGLWIGILIGLKTSEPIKLPNACILHEDAIYCKEANN